ncbi:MAG TPA: antibiotic biosynthesis monooxygenase [Candidatus Binatia bacterium]|jgi:antibiotic biosynthesis monooxygenase (ABM) superfamily enzyme|nr:antibiotic biosynthesis monooxygenase [Candidatus Binatia bacterium]
MTSSGATIVTHTRVRDDRHDEFARWQHGVGAAAAGVPGFIEQIVMPPRSPSQTDWVILQWFASAGAALAWLGSDQRRDLLAAALPMLIGPDDIHIVEDAADEGMPAPASAVISARIKPGSEAAYRAWEHRIAGVLARAKGFQGYRFEPPIAGAQERWVVIMRFDCDTSLQEWLRSPQRLELMKDAEPFTDHLDARLVRTGFDQWFTDVEPGASPAAWKMSMLVLLILYPVVFLFGFLLTPSLADHGSPPWLSLFASNVTCVILLNWLVPWISRRFAWWLVPQGPTTDVQGATLLVGLYATALLTFAWLSNR